MKKQLKDVYGRRITPGVKILMLVVIIFLGMHLAFNEASHGSNKHADKMIVE
jgi:hypothetical protein